MPKIKTIAIGVLLEIGFIDQGKHELDEGDYYRYWVFSKNDSEIQVTYEYNSKNEVTAKIIDFNGQTLKGREIEFKDLLNLISIL